MDAVHWQPLQRTPQGSSDQLTNSAFLAKMNYDSFVLWIPFKGILSCPDAMNAEGLHIWKFSSLAPFSGSLTWSFRRCWLQVLLWKAQRKIRRVAHEFLGSSKGDQPRGVLHCFFCSRISNTFYVLRILTRLCSYCRQLPIATFSVCSSYLFSTSCGPLLVMASHGGSPIWNRSCVHAPPVHKKSGVAVLVLAAHSVHTI